MSFPSFWESRESQKRVEELKECKEKYEEWGKLNKEAEQLKEFIDLVKEDPSFQGEVDRQLQALERGVSSFEAKVFLRDKFDREDAIVSINSGAGGLEACDWAGMLFRMYSLWAESKNYKVEVVDCLPEESAGFKNITFLVKGKYAYGYLKAEKGVHRLVRISPFDANKRRHTSFASVDVIPQVSEEVEIDIKPQDLKIETFRASGHGGQHVNVTDSAVRITHLPSGIVVSCQAERSQYQNKQTALKILKSKLYNKLQEEKRKELEDISGEKKKIEWGSQIRSYILHPYSLVKDHRTRYETSQALAVLDGELDGFIEAYLKSKNV
ncbi:MAG: peptide chain release factor 2 [Candidatus Omnitrophica bacterium]|nr:peptide chain release factor 2 [Candidatus Omnitrophota bacterium]